MESGGLLHGDEAPRRAVDKIVASPVLHGSESLCNLLRYLTRHALERPGTPLKEYQIATELLGRPTGFDPRLDSSVRVQTGRLRAKLAEYYAGPGAEDAVVIEIPKGSYSLVFHARTPIHGEPERAGTIPVAPVPPRVLRPVLGRWWVLAAVAAATGLLSYAITGGRHAMAARQPSDAFHTFWKPFLENGEDAPVVVYGIASSGGNESTGVGDVMAIHALDIVFSQFHQMLRVKRSGLLTWDDAKTSHLIFVGPSEDLPLGELPASRAFAFRPQAGSNPGRLAIVNVRPRTGEQPFYAARRSAPVAEDYALVSLQPGLNPGKRILALAGITTFGTQAAAEYVCEPGSLAELASKVGRVKSFEAVLHVKVSGGVPVRSEVVALRLE